MRATDRKKAPFRVGVLSVVKHDYLPRAIADRLHNDIIAVIKAPDHDARLADSGMVPTALPATEFVAFVQAEIRKWGPIVKAAGVKPN